MSGTAMAPSLQVALPEATTLAVVFVLLSGGLLGMSIRNMFESIMADEAEDDGGELVDEQTDDGLMTDDGGGGDELGGLGGLDDGDDLGGFGEDDEFGDMDGGGGNTDELEHRLDELENEVGNLSSTVNTVRNENEQISGSVEEVEENVRKLLDIYEMVTRGVNPFANDIEAGMGGGMNDDSFGLFADDEGDEKEEEDIDEDIADADAEGFFNDDLAAEDDDTAPDTGVDDMLGGGGDDDAFQDSFDEEFEDAADGFEDVDVDDGIENGGDEDEGGGGGTGTSFEELKDEYDSGEADWANGDPDGNEAGPDDAGPAEDVTDDLDDELADDLGDELADDELFDEVIEPDGEVAEANETESEPAGEEEAPDSAHEPEPSPDDQEASTEPSPDDQEASTEPSPDDQEASTEPEGSPDNGQKPSTAPEPAGDADAATGAGSEAAPETNGTAGGGQEAAGSEAASGGGKPYLATLPEGFASDLIVIEWLEFLVEEVGVRETDGAIDYYESIDWIDERVAEDLREYLAGFEKTGNESLTIDHHARSLEYISQLNGGAGAVGATGLQKGGGLDGIQR